jgi:hypothetical protein
MKGADKHMFRCNSWSAMENFKELLMRETSVGTMYVCPTMSLMKVFTDCFRCCICLLDDRITPRGDGFVLFRLMQFMQPMVDRVISEMKD